jgi:hypothetical protein
MLSTVREAAAAGPSMVGPSIDDTGAEPSKTSSIILAKVDSIVTAGLGAEREPTKTARNAKLTVKNIIKLIKKRFMNISRRKEDKIK